MYFCVRLDHFIPVLYAFIVLGSVSSITSEVIGWEECLFVESDVKPSTQSVTEYFTDVTVNVTFESIAYTIIYFI